MFLNIIYILATLSLLVGTSLSFSKSLSDYFYLVGTSLFCINAIFKTISDIRTKNKQKMKINTSYNQI